MPIKDKLENKDTIGAGNTVVNIALWLLNLKDFDLKQYCWPARTKLSSLLLNVQKKHFLAILEDKDLLELIDQLEVSLLKISTDVTKMEKQLEVYIEDGLEEKNENVKKEIQKNNESIEDLGATLVDTQNNNQPKFWSSYLADSNPGFFKSIFLFFIWQSAIDKAKDVCSNFNKKIHGLEQGIQRLTQRNERLDGLKDSYESQLADKKELEKNLEALKISKTSLKKCVEGLKKAADTLSIKKENKLKEESEFADSESTKPSHYVVTENSEEDEDTFPFQW